MTPLEQRIADATAKRHKMYDKLWTDLPRQALDAKELNRMHDAEIDIIGPTCGDCGGVQATDTTPGNLAYGWRPMTQGK